MRLPAPHFYLGLAAAILAAWPLAFAQEWADHPGARIMKVQPRGSKEAGFTLVPSAQSGLLFTNLLNSADQESNHNLLNGAGVALGDVDGDGLCDVFLVSIGGSCGLYRNKGNWQFEDITTEAGVALARLFAHGAVLADVDGDQDLDLAVTFTDIGMKLFLNDGKARFSPVENPQFTGEWGSSSLALADTDGDGDLDLYLANYGAKTTRSGATISTTIQNGREVVVGRMRNRLRIVNGMLVEHGEPDRFYVNQGNGQFRQTPFTSGSFLDERGQPLQGELWDLGLSVMFRDINQDGLPDIYVCNDFQNPDRIWINKGSGKFQLIARHAIRSSPHFSMGVDFADLDRDGWDDFMVVDMLSRRHTLRMTQMSPEAPGLMETLEEALDRPQARRNMVYWNRGDGTYAEIAFYSGLDAADWAWCPVFLDVDLDGWEDVLITNGHAYDTQDLDAIDRNKQMQQRSGKKTGNFLRTFPPLLTPNYAFRNGGALKFEEVGQSWGFNSTQVSHGIALGDLDNDGDLDVVVNSLNAPALLYRNESSKPRVAVQLKGAKGNSKGIGARITVRAPGMPEQAQEVIAGGRYLSSDQPVRSFALAKATDKAEVRVRWPNGTESVVKEAPANSIIEISESSAAPAPPAKPADAPRPLFAETRKIQFTHTPSPRNDFEFQPLLLQSWSSVTPSAALFDANGDKAPDLLVTGNPGQPLQAFINNNGKAFTPRLLATNLGGTERNLVVALGSGPGATLVLAELPIGGRPAATTLREIAVPTGAVRPLVSSNILWGALAAADVDGDGALDLFAGARLVPGQYPASIPSLLIPRQNGALDPSKARRIEAGIVTGAVFTDLNADQKPDLVVANELGPVRVFINENGQLVERTREMRLGDKLGFWSSLTAADLDGDNRPDLIAGNLGLNSVHQPPMLVYHGDFDQNTIREIFPANPDTASGKEFPFYGLNTLRAGSPLLAEKFATHLDYSQADMGLILGEALSSAQKVKVNWTASTAFLNRGSHFEAVELPFEAQLSPVFAIAAADFNGDGHTDLFLSQNFFGVRPDLFRMDSGRGLLLRGQGQGKFQAMNARESGIEIYGEQRGAIAADFNLDGKPDLLVMERGGPAHLFENQVPAKGEPRE